MTYSLLVLATLALVCLTTGQLNPQTQCGQQAQTCYNQNKDNIRKKFDELDFRGGCKDARTLFSCLNGVPGADACNELQTFKNLAINTTDGICQPGGEGTTICADRLGPCLQYAFIIKNDFANSNATQACPALNQLNSCAEDIMKQNSCNPNINKQLNRARTALSEDIMLNGCDGPCAQAIGKCQLKLAGDVSSQPLSKTNWTDFCIQGFSAINCVGNLSSTSGACRGSSDPQLVKTMMNSYTAYLKDYCTDTGAPSQCMVGLELCKVDLTTLTSKSTVDQECA
ncbi:unnamed protein product [Lymnaea stagnalis]|uniref:Uncharacterized protein n=1 Tax=Lymnaea stagnalis TaxID=6523 RepID=A0AAV2I333_LYMST